MRGAEGAEGVTETLPSGASRIRGARPCVHDDDAMTRELVMARRKNAPGSPVRLVIDEVPPTRKAMAAARVGLAGNQEDVGLLDNGRARDIGRGGLGITRGRKQTGQNDEAAGYELHTSYL